MKPARSLRIHHSIVSFASAVLLVSAGPVAAQGSAPGRDFNKLLDGEYTYTGSGACISSSSGFNDKFQPTELGTGSVHSFSVNGTRKFNGDGTGVLNLVSVSVNQGAGSALETVDAPFTYTVDSNLNITVISGPSNSRSTAGPVAGSTGILTGVPPMTGRVSEDLSTITLSHPLPGVETITPSVGEPIYRVCWRQRVLHRVKRR